MPTLVPIDDSESALESVRYAAERFGDQDITLVTISSMNVGSYTEGSGYACDQILERQNETMEMIFANAIELLSSSDCNVETKVITGRPVREIIALAESTDTDHIVVSENFKSSLLEILFRSIAEQLVRQAPVPVTVVH
ncbi:universal stress protein [Natronorubrum halophilum]|uniref:universal stress protein n=1 Tax=Natronorubrum halophilum TaxID=1702106 RepID=UPI000EF6E9D5|nr:universal stress protein [Natronorubrum halophilum]